MKDSRVNNIRTIAIILVVIGHSIIMYSPTWSLGVHDVNYPILDYTKRAIDLLQMPLFFSLSGYLFYYSMKKQTKYSVFVLKKIKRLIIPYICVALFWMIPIKMLAHYPKYNGKGFYDIVIKGIILGEDNGHLWFLVILFIIFIIFYWLFKILNRNGILLVAGFVLAIVLCLASNKLNGIAIVKCVAEYTIWFYLGYLICHYFDSIKKVVEKNKIIKIILTLLSVALIVVSIITMNGYILMATSFIVIISLFVIISNKQNKTCDFTSKNTFGIYLFHSPLIYLTLYYMKDTSPFITIPVNLIVFGGMALGITLLIRKTKLKFIIGE